MWVVGQLRDDIDHDGESTDFREIEHDIKTDIDRDNDESYSYGSHHYRGRVGDSTGDLKDVHPHRQWGTGEGCAVSATSEWGSGEQGGL